MAAQLSGIDVDETISPVVKPATIRIALSLAASTLAGCPTTRRSTLRYYVFLGNNLLSWFSKSQLTLFQSSAKAKYRGVSNVVAETC
ncbi:ribonuclease H-like domain-containing protein [Tanacetum coccineum]